MTARTETDSFGPLEVPSERYYGAQTARSLINFKIGEQKMPAPLVRALGVVKKAAALANKELGNLDPKLADAIADAAQDVIDGVKNPREVQAAIPELQGGPHGIHTVNSRTVFVVHI